MSNFENIGIIYKTKPQAASDPRLRSVDFRISHGADDSWIKCFERAYYKHITKEEFYGKPELIAQQINPPVWVGNEQFFIQWLKEVVEDPKTYQEIIDFMKKCVGEANDCYRKQMR